MFNYGMSFACAVCFAVGFVEIQASGKVSADQPVREEVIRPFRKASFNNDGKCSQRKQGGNLRDVNGYQVFDGSTDGNRQVDPQIAIGGGYVLHGTNSGLIVYDKQGNFIQGVSQRCFNNGIDPKLFFDNHNRIFGFDLWNPWDKAKKKPVNISVSETDDPTGAWNTYAVAAPGGRDGGAIGYSTDWIGYSFPGGQQQTFVMATKQVKAGEPANVYHFAGNLGAPVMNQDADETLYFVRLQRQRIRVVKVFASAQGRPISEIVFDKPHGFKFFDWPPKSPQKGTDQKTASGDRNPKNIVLQNGCLWFSHAVNCRGRSAVQWHQVKLDGTFVQSGLISDLKNSFIQTTIAVNKAEDVLVGFQETGPKMFISPRFAFRRKTDPHGELRPMVSMGEGQAATDGVAWGDYSGSTIDADNGQDLWTIQSIAGADGKGDTVIVRVPLGKDAD